MARGVDFLAEVNVPLLFRARCHVSLNCPVRQLSRQHYTTIRTSVLPANQYVKSGRQLYP